MMSKKDTRQFFKVEEPKLTEEARKFLYTPPEYRTIQFQVKSPWHLLNFKLEQYAYASLDMNGLRIGEYVIPWEYYLDSWIVYERLPLKYFSGEEVITVRAKKFLKKDYPVFHATCIREKHDEEGVSLTFRIPFINFPPPTLIVMSQVIHRAYEVSRSS